MTTEEKIIRMANQIAMFFESKPEEAGVQGVAEHINKFWEKRMRTTFFEELGRNETEFHELVIKAAPHIQNPNG